LTEESSGCGKEQTSEKFCWGGTDVNHTLNPKRVGLKGFQRSYGEDETGGSYKFGGREGN